MFSLKESMKFLKAAPEEIEEVLTSVNAPFVAAPGHSSEATRAYICSLTRSPGTRSLYIYLHLTQSNKGLMYIHDKESLGPPEFSAAKSEATEFVESMGFIMERAEFKGEAISSLPPFMEDLSLLKNEKEEEEEEVELTEISPDEPSKKDAQPIVPLSSGREPPSSGGEPPAGPVPGPRREKEGIDIEVETPPEPLRAAQPPPPSGKRVIGKIKLKDIVSHAGEDKQARLQIEAVLRFLSSL